MGDEQQEEQVFPKPLSGSMIEELNQYVIVEPYPFVIDLEKSKGMYLATVDGDQIFDWSGLYGSKLIGFNHDRMYEADYLKRLAVAANNKMANPDYLTKECLDYYRLLFQLAPNCMAKASKKVELYVVNSGAEAVENMMKYFIYLHHQRLLREQKSVNNRRFVYFDQAFHGRTLFALNITKLAHDPLITRDYHGLVPGNMQVPFPAVDHSLSYEENRKEMESALLTLEHLVKLYRDEIVAVILEPIQGAGGQRVALPEFYQRLSELCHKHSILLGIDEVQTSGGQTGSFFCIDLFNLPHPPQAVASAKKLGNGVLYMLESMDDVGLLDSTWGGSLCDMVRFMQEWKIIRDEKLLEQVAAKGAHLVNCLQELTAKFPHLIYNVRGLGLYQGFSLKLQSHKAKLIDLALNQEEMLLLGAGKESIRFRPPLDVTMNEIDLMIQKLARTLSKL
ncbi:MAG: aminotransferase class III-fold pyridoxal phosphate-dependent enzyme [Oligoflexia bacterium]|nr:aminotransferase class III-fold pyridoxal phosphate-dependent enzyme [Oligoflexia bacterium]MBF0366756.1 aminotransferase class III-fold pyridoxal phosphate-dependent enzyme [Oligoflexia bacterium]